jgi:transcription elongation factor Elf1
VRPSGGGELCATGIATCSTCRDYLTSRTPFLSAAVGELNEVIDAMVEREMDRRGDEPSVDRPAGSGAAAFRQSDRQSTGPADPRGAARSGIQARSRVCRPHSVGNGADRRRTARWGGSLSPRRVLLERRRPDAQWPGRRGLQPQGRRIPTTGASPASPEATSPPLPFRTAGRTSRIRIRVFGG